MSSGGIAARLYRGELGVNVVGRRKFWFGIAGLLLLIAIAGMLVRGFTPGIEFKGGNEFQVPASVGTLQEVQTAVSDAGATVYTGQQIGDAGKALYSIRTGPVSTEDSLKIKQELADKYKIDANRISDNQVSKAWGDQVTQQALISLAIFIVVVVIYLVIRFEWRMAVGAVASLLLNLVCTAGVYALIGFEVTPSTVIGFLTILGFALYDVVVVFDKVQENTRGITGSATSTYAEAANLAVNQTMMRSINTGLVALLPVGGLLFIGAGLLKAGTLKDLGLVLFFGMGFAVYSSIFFASPVLVELKSREPRLAAHTQRVLAKRSANQKTGMAKAAGGGTIPGRSTKLKNGRVVSEDEASESDETESTEVSALASAAPRPGARSGGNRSGRPGPAKRGSGRAGGGRPSGKRR
jgi:preprotein translocase subunit SecF